MLRSFYIASTGMLTQRKNMDIVTNNIINVDTTGYKKDTMVTRSFKDLMIERTEGDVIGPQNTGIHVDDVWTSYRQGDMELTDQPADVALEGEGFFVINTADGPRYTRDGSFAVSPEGYLVTADGNYVQGNNGRIYVGNDEFTINDQGSVIVDDVTVDKLRVVTFPDLAGLEKVNANMFAAGTAGAPQQAEDYKVKQGFLEASNADVAEEMVDMMQLNRSYQVNQRVLTMLDQSLSKTVNEVGRL